MRDTTDKVIDLVNVVLKQKSVNAHSKMGSPPQWDSLNHIKIMLELEKAFQIKVLPGDVAKLTTIQTIVEYIQTSK